MPRRSCARFGPATCMSSVDGIATPPAFEFSAANASGTAREGDELPAAGGPVQAARAQQRAGVVHDDDPQRRGTPLRRSPRARVHGRGAGRGRGVLGRDPGRGHTVADEQPDLCASGQFAGRSHRAAAGARQPAATAHRRAVENHVARRVRPDVARGRRSSGGRCRGRMEPAEARRGCASALPTDRRVLQYAALVVDLAAGLAGNDRLVFTGRAEQPMRISVQLRSDRGSWQRSVYIDTVDQERTVFFDDLTPAAGADTDKPPRGRNPRHPVRRRCRQHQARHVGPRVDYESGAAAMTPRAGLEACRQVRTVNTM